MKVAFDAPLKKREEVRRALVRATKSALGGQVAGYALVTWDVRGNTQSHIMTADSVFSRSLVPALVYAQLVKHDSVITIEDRLFSPDGAS